MLVHKTLFTFSEEIQVNLFLIGVLLIGVPHGAADLLVASRNAITQKKKFSTLNFLFVYIGRLLIFALLLWYSLLFGIFIFILFAAYHFGETDLFKFNTSKITGKLFVISYGLLILGSILLNNYEEVVILLSKFNLSEKDATLISWIGSNKTHLLTGIILSFFSSSFIHFSIENEDVGNKGLFIIELIIILLIISYLPMILGFTFYFIVWHSTISLSNILGYLNRERTIRIGSIVKEMLLYSSIAIVGTCLVGFFGFMYTDGNSLIVYTFLALAVLTAPHMQIMHEMYCEIRKVNKAFT